MKTWLNVFSMVLIISLAACDKGADSPRGFSLPEGSIVRGEAAFVKYQCLTCHALQGFEDETIDKEITPPILLGGQSARVKTYAELVTSIINPSHKLAPRYAVNVTQENGISKMRVYNEVMTVNELVDLVTFLQPKYKLQPLQLTRYERYVMPN